MGWNYLPIPKLQRLHRWSLWMDKKVRPTLYNGCNDLSMLGLKLIHVCKGAPGSHPKWTGDGCDASETRTSDPTSIFMTSHDVRVLRHYHRCGIFAHLPTHSRSISIYKPFYSVAIDNAVLFNLATIVLLVQHCFIQCCHRRRSLPRERRWPYWHYSDVIMGTMASQVTSLTIVFSTVCLGADQRKH